MDTDPQAPLKNMKKKHDFFVGIDSDGCAFDTMEVKHKACFYPMTVRHWNLAAVAKYVRDAWDFVNLYSKTRGCNRFHAILYVLDFLRERREVMEAGVTVPDPKGLREWVKRESKLGNPALKAEVEKNPDPDLQQAMRWSFAINEDVAKTVHDVPPFPHVREVLEKLSQKADVIVVSATPNEALEREWKEHDIAKYVKVIAGQERGKKGEHLKLAAGGKYDNDKILMIGDAPGDMKAARSVNALFYPVNPGDEVASWEYFAEEAMDKFLSGEYAGEYEKKLIEKFDTYLPEMPSWKE